MACAATTSGAVSAVLFAFILISPWSLIFVFFIPAPAILYAVFYVGYSIWMDRKGGDRIKAKGWQAGFASELQGAKLAVQAADAKTTRNTDGVNACKCLLGSCFG